MEILSQTYSGLDSFILSLKQIDALLMVVQTTELTELKPDTFFNSLGAIRSIVRIMKINCEELFSQFEKLEISENS